MTGANSGIGLATAIALGRAGAEVVVNHVVGREAADDAVRRIEGYGVRAVAHEADVSDEAQVLAMFARMIEEFGRIDILVANAGLQSDAAFTDMTVEQWHKVVDMNLAPHGIRVNAVAPGAIRTPINRDAWQTPEAERDLLTLIPYRRVGDPQDIADAVVVLASDLMDYVVGTTIYIDDGMTFFPGFAEGG
ncbi:SDR family oxidoreductase [Actinospica durhamensis]|uniref:SDR family oxidoreductase n=1 Tax=Actinospica durhamensis TaxID=1508375 RepID=A0A941ISQ8_9ACTN|nr:SDR family oxidoreductase [Actinospica durhamensis]MBR7835153.1 SDR family oxidoreductase [Actinospica durhamensis]